MMEIDPQIGGEVDFPLAFSCQPGSRNEIIQRLFDTLDVGTRVILPECTETTRLGHPIGIDASALFAPEPLPELFPSSEIVGIDPIKYAVLKGRLQRIPSKRYHERLAEICSFLSGEEFLEMFTNVANKNRAEIMVWGYPVDIYNIRFIVKKTLPIKLDIRILSGKFGSAKRAVHILQSTNKLLLESS